VIGIEFFPSIPLSPASQMEAGLPSSGDDEEIYWKEG
jgi:hypothetical protein